MGDAKELDWESPEVQAGLDALIEHERQREEHHASQPPDIELKKEIRKMETANQIVESLTEILQDGKISKDANKASRQLLALNACIAMIQRTHGDCLDAVPEFCQRGDVEPANA